MTTVVQQECVGSTCAVLAALVQPQVSQSYCFTIAMDHGTKGCMNGSKIQLNTENEKT